MSSSKMRSLASYTSGFDNNLNLIRFVAASMVIVAHCYPLTGTPAEKGPFMRLVGVDGGTIGVNIFFMLSGLLITASYLRNSDIVRYIKARVLRIYPGLIVAVLISAYLFGLFFTTEPWPNFVAHDQTLAFVAVNSLLISDVIQLRYQLPGVFENNPTAYAVNGSLWTLPYELWMYIFLLALGVLGILRRQRWTNFFIGGFVLCYLVAQAWVDLPIFYKLDNFERFASFFMVGIALYVNRSWVPIHWGIAVALGATAIIGYGTRYYPMLFSTALLYGVLWVGYVPDGAIRHFNNWGDYSYGLYIYAFPVQQGLVVLWPDIRPWQMGIIAFIITFIFAFGSWHLIEKQALRLKRVAGHPLTPRRAAKRTELADKVIG